MQWLCTCDVSTTFGEHAQPKIRYKHTDLFLDTVGRYKSVSMYICSVFPCSYSYKWFRSKILAVNEEQFVKSLPAVSYLAWYVVVIVSIFKFRSGRGSMWIF